MKKLLYIAFTLLSLSGFSQNETNWWFFGTNGGLNFTSGSPVPAFGGQTSTSEGSSSVCDATGNLLFYSEGTSAWDASHTVMPNGGGLLGYTSSTQSALIVPQPGTNDIFYLFTTDAVEFGGANGFRYSVIDMTMNGGMGDITAVKNVLLFAPCSEQISAIKHANCIDWWIMAKGYNDNIYHCFLLTATGLSGPFTSTLGLGIGTIPYGQGKFSPNGTKYVISTQGLTQLFDFDNSTGLLSNPIDIVGGSASGSGGDDTYGVCFSGNNQFIYVMKGMSADDLYQYDITSNNQATILATETFLGTTTFYPQLQLAKDFKIYISNSGGTTFSVINSPNTAGAGAGFSLNSVPIGGSSSLGVCNFPDSYFNQSNPCTSDILVYGEDVSCPGLDDGMAWVETITGTAPFTYSWSPGGSTNDTIFNLSPGWYEVTVIDSFGNVAIDSVEIQVAPPMEANASADDTVCINGTFTFSASANGGTLPYTYAWTGGFTGAGAGPHNDVPTAADSYIVTVTDDNGCTADDTVFVYLHSSLLALTSGDVQACEGSPVLIGSGATGGQGAPYTFTWYETGNPVPVGNTASVSVTPTADSTEYCVVVSDGCTTPDDTACMIVSFYPQLFPAFTADTTSGCAPVEINFTNSLAAGTYQSAEWFFGDGSSSFAGNNATHTYAVPNNDCYDVTLEITSLDGCISDTTYTDLICIEPYPDAEFLYNPMELDIYNTEVTFTNISSPDAVTFEWFFYDSLNNVLDSSTLQHPVFAFPAQGPGNYPVWLHVSNINGCTDSVLHYVIINDVFTLYIPNSFTPNGNGINDIFYPVGTNFDADDYQFYVFNRWGEVIFKTTDPAEGWDGTHKGMKSKEDVYVWRIIVKSGLGFDKIDRIGHVTLLR